MTDHLAKIRIAGLVVHAAAAVTLLILFSKTGTMTALYVVPGLLIGSGAAAAIPGRPLTLYGAFGSLMSMAFWGGVSAINRADYLDLIPPLLLVTGASWLLREPGWPPVVFTVVTVALDIGLKMRLYANRFDFPEVEPDWLRRFVTTTTVILIVGAVYAVAGFAEVFFTEMARRRKRKAGQSRGIRTPMEPPIL